MPEQRIWPDVTQGRTELLTTKHNNTERSQERVAGAKLIAAQQRVAIRRGGRVSVAESAVHCARQRLAGRTVCLRLHHLRNKHHMVCSEMQLWSRDA